MNIYYWEADNVLEKHNLSWDEPGRKHLEEQLTELAESEVGNSKKFTLSVPTNAILQLGQEGSETHDSGISIIIESAPEGTWNISKKDNIFTLKIGMPWLCFLVPMLSIGITSIGPEELESKLYFRTP